MNPSRPLSTATRASRRGRDFRKLRIECLENRLLLTGNGAPNGEHFTLNLIGVPDRDTPNMDGGGHVIFVRFEGRTKIELSPGEDFQVLDKNGLDRDGAAFQLPDPGLDPYVPGNAGDADTVADYSVYARPGGGPGGYSTLTTCADVVESNLSNFLSGREINILNDAGAFGGVCSVEQVGQDITFRDRGRSTFTDVTAELLTIVLEVQVDSDGDGIADDDTIEVRVPIFDDILENEYWEYDNNRLRLLQLRFYPIPNDLEEGGNGLHVAGEPSSVLVGQQLTPELLEQATQQAMALWASADDTAALTTVDMQIGQLPGTMLGYATHDTVWIDDNAAGYGWSGSLGVGVDLVEVLEHEFGHVLGFDHDHGGVMAATLAPQLVNSALAPTDVLVADFSLPLSTQQQERDALFGEIEQSDDSDTLDVHLADVLPVAHPEVSRLDRLFKRVETDILEDELESLEDSLEDFEAA